MSKHFLPLLALLFLVSGLLAAEQKDWASVLAEVATQRASDPLSALELLDRSLGDEDPLAWSGDQLGDLATLYRFRVEILRSMGNYERASLEAERFAALASLSGDTALTARAIFLRGTIQAEQGFFGQALEHFHNARQLVEGTGLHAETALFLNAIGMTHHFARDADQAKTYFERALAEARLAEDPFLVATYLSNLANSAADLEDPNLAIDIQREALAIGEAIAHRQVIAQANISVCNFLVQARRFDEAEAQCALALEAANGLESLRWQAGIRLTLGKLETGLGRLDAALDWFEEALALARDAVPVVHEELLQRLAELHLAMGAPELAAERYRELLAFRDARVERERQALSDELEVRYQLERFQTELDLLRLSQDLHDSQLRVRNISLIALAMILVLTLLGAALVVRTSRQRAALQQDLAKRNGELQQALDHISELARRDPLTGLLNRRAMLERSTQELARSRRQGSPISLLMCDVDHFKPINDAHGHAVGDEVLVAIAARLRQSFRETDLVARWGGEEFLCVLPDTSVAEAEVSLARLRQELARQPLHTSAGPMSITLTWGVAELTGYADADAGNAIATAIRQADQALYQGKRAGRDRTVVQAFANESS
ncbi:MAG: diguanylate cyclase domain-containing protein [Wenzhouxiangella sp.]